MKKAKTDLFIVVNPVGSKFAKALQGAVRERTNKKILRVSQPKINRINFKVTPNVLNKIQQLQAFNRDGVSCPEFTTTRDGVGELNAKRIFARTLINSTNGRGIVEFGKDDDAYPPAPLYTGYIPKKKEFRVHVFGDKVIDVQEKRKKKGYDNERDTHIRNVANGYVYCRDNVELSEEAQRLGVRSVAACGYQYGAVDIIYNEKLNEYYVLEVNSRPGLMGTTLEKYADALIEMYKL